MKLVGYKDLKGNIKNSNERKLKIKSVIRCELIGLISVVWIPLIKFITGIHNDEAIKTMLLNIILSFNILNLFVIKIMIPLRFETIKKLVEISDEKLYRFVKKLQEYGIYTTLENIKEAEIGKSLPISNKYIKEIPPCDTEILEATKDSIKLKTIDGNIVALKQFKLKIMNYLNEIETRNYLYLDGEPKEETGQVKKLEM